MNPLDLLTRSTPAAIVDRHDIPGTPERLRRPAPAYRSGPLAAWLKTMTGGASKVWLHQAMAQDALIAGHNVVLATGTGSGKSLVFQGDMIRRLLANPDATGFALYPAKALASDQLHRWHEAFAAAGLAEDLVAELHGDILPDERHALLGRARLIVATEDIVHAWFMRLLASAGAQRFLKSLEFVAIDEAHDLQGVFGSNCAMLFRRLRHARKRALGGAGEVQGDIQFVAASATIADPAGHLEALTGLPFAAIGEEHNGAPRHPKTLLHLEGPESGPAAQMMLAELVGSIMGEIGPDAVIAFADGRQAVEFVASTIGSDEVEPYRAGYELEDRTSIATAMREGRLRGVVATSALELGIHVPQFSLGLNLGVPISKRAFRQRAGRVGRSGPGVFAVIAEPSAFAKLGTSLREFYEGEPESSPLYLENPVVQFQNACCLLEECGGDETVCNLLADIEWPAGFDEMYRLALPGALRPREIEHLANQASGSPHLDYPLRRIGDGKFALRIHRDNGGMMGTIDDAKALREAYPGATYRHRKVPYQVVEWRSTGYERSIYLRRLKNASRTTPIARTQVSVSHEPSELLDGHLLTGRIGSLAEIRLQIAESVEGYRRGKADLLYRDLAKKDRRLSRKQRQFSTTGVLIRIDEPWFRGGGASAKMREQVGKALTTVLLRKCGIASGEIRYESSGIAVHGAGGPKLVDDALVIFDDVSGGLRLTAPLFRELEQFLKSLHRGAELAGTDALLDEVSVARLKRWHDTLGEGAPSPACQASLLPHQRLIFAPLSRVGVRINGSLAERKLLAHQLFELGGCQHLAYTYETAPGVTALVFHDQVEPIGHDWQYRVWDTETGAVQEIAA